MKLNRLKRVTVVDERALLTWEERRKRVEKLHAFVATLRLGAATLFKEP